MPLFLFIFIFSVYIHSFHHIRTIRNPIANRRGSSLSPHRWSAQWEKSLPLVPSRESNSLGPALQQADALPSEQHRTLSEQHRPYVAVPSNLIFSRNSVQNLDYSETHEFPRKKHFSLRGITKSVPSLSEEFFRNRISMATLQSGSFSSHFPSQLSSLCLPVPSQKFPLLSLKANIF